MQLDADVKLFGNIDNSPLHHPQSHRLHHSHRYAMVHNGRPREIAANSGDGNGFAVQDGTSDAHDDHKWWHTWY